jgi:ubiquinone/menaquinone biosynthesis C-methylase UbiE
MSKLKQRVPEGGAIVNSSKMTAQQYSDLMRKMLWKQYVSFAENVIEKVAPAMNSKILDIGSGPGWGSISLLKIRPDLYLEGIDASADMVAVSNANARLEQLDDGIKYIVGNAEEMSALADNHYDVVVSRESLHHWEKPERVFKEIVRVLKENGKVCIYDHRRDLNFFGKMIVSVFGIFKAGKMVEHWKSSIAASYTYHEVREMLDLLGLKDWIVEIDLMNIVIYKK